MSEHIYQLVCEQRFRSLWKDFFELLHAWRRLIINELFKTYYYDYLPSLQLIILPRD